MQQAELVDEALLGLPLWLLGLVRARVAMDRRADAPKRVSILLVVDVVENGEVADQVLHFWREDLPARRAGENVACPEVQQAALTEGVPAQ